MRRFLCLSLLSAVGALAVAPASHASVTYGVSDQQASTFTNPLFAPLKLKAARYVIPWDVMSDSTQLSAWDKWYKAATAAHERILISIEHSRTPGVEQSTPTLEQYQTATQKFHDAYPSVKEINTWNEVNACQKGSRTERQPLGICRPSKAKLLYQFYGANKKVFGSSATIIPVDVLDDRATSAGAAVRYIKAFKKVAKKRPSIWGVHNYSDTNRFSQVRFKHILKAIGSKGSIWLLETGGQLNVFGGSQATKEAKAAKALKCMFYIAKHQPRVKRNYIYQFNGAPVGARFDAGLINVDNTIRPGYTVVKKRQSAKC